MCCCAPGQRLLRLGILRCSVPVCSSAGAAATACASEGSPWPALSPAKQRRGVHPPPPPTRLPAPAEIGVGLTGLGFLFFFIGMLFFFDKGLLAMGNVS